MICLEAFVVPSMVGLFSFVVVGCCDAAVPRLSRLLIVYNTTVVVWWPTQWSGVCCAVSLRTLTVLSFSANSIEGTEYDDGRNEPCNLNPRLVPPAARSFFADWITRGELTSLASNTKCGCGYCIPLQFDRYRHSSSQLNLLIQRQLVVWWLVSFVLFSLLLLVLDGQVKIVRQKIVVLCFFNARKINANAYKC